MLVQHSGGNVTGCSELYKVYECDWQRSCVKFMVGMCSTAQHCASMVGHDTLQNT